MSISCKRDRGFLSITWIHRVFLGASLLLLSPRADASFVLPDYGHTSGGNWVYYAFGAPQFSLEGWTFYFGDSPALAAETDGSGGLYLQVPPHPPGIVNICFEYLFSIESGIQCTPDTYIYLDAPEINSMVPKEQSFLPDPVTVKFIGAGFSIYPGIKVIFGEQSASEVFFDYERDELTCVPPPFPAGSPIPLVVDVRIINPGGGETVLPGAYTYKQITPKVTRLLDSFAPAFRYGKYVYIYADKIVSGPVQAWFDGIPANTEAFQFAGQTKYTLVCIVPPHAPGKVDVTVLNGDGEIYTAQNAFEYIGTPSTDFHTADQNQDFQLSISEILRTVQLFNSDGFHCDATTEDGYLSGPEGDQTCTPHASDYDPQDWKISLPELLQLIQFYNLHCYEPCTSDPSGYCPPIDYRVTRE